MSALNNKWVVYTDPKGNEDSKMGKKRATKENKLSNLVFERAQFIAVPNFKKHCSDKYLTVEEVAHPDYDPWIRLWASKYSNIPTHNNFKGYVFYYHPKTESIYYKSKIDKSSNIGNKKSVLRKIPFNRKIYKKLLEKISSLKPKVSQKLLFGVGRQYLDTGFIYASYTPMSFSPSIMTKYGKKMHK